MERRVKQNTISQSLDIQFDQKVSIFNQQYATLQKYAIVSNSLFITFVNVSKTEIKCQKRCFWSIQMIKQSQIRNFISLIARKNTKVLSPPIATSNGLLIQEASPQRRYETETIRIQSEKSQRDSWLGYKKQTLCGQELVTHNYIKLSLYEKYRRSLNEKKNQSLKTEPILHSDSQQQLKSNVVVFPLKRPALKTVIKSKSLIKSRILSTPTHLMHLHPIESESLRQKNSKLPKLPLLHSQQLIPPPNQKQQDFHKPIFKIKKYQPLNYQAKVDQAYNLFSESTKPEIQPKAKTKPRIEKWVKWSMRGKKCDKDQEIKCFREELLQESICGWAVQQIKNRCDYDV